jgi:cytidylate kinase
LSNPETSKELDVSQIITVDGPAASGKSTLAQRLAQALGYLYFDTGVMYRALTWLALQQGIAMEDEESLTSLAEKVTIEVTPPSKSDGRAYDVWIGDQDITWAIRQPQVDANVSIVSTYPGVRRALSEQQRRIGLRGRVVMVGRDIGTVVLPEAGIKIYLDASLEERARRRFREMRARGEQVSYAEVLQSLRERDWTDLTRAVAPLRPADDAVHINSDGQEIEQVFETVMQIVRARQKQTG